MIAYHRWSDGGPGDDVVVVLNFSSQGYSDFTIGFPRDGMWRVRLHSDWVGYDAYFGNWFSYDTQAGPPGVDSMPFSANVGIGPYSALILSQG
jgi:1,4-alpha-glucan branching enzyme